MACITKKRGRLVIDFYDQHGKRRLKTLPEGMSKKNARKALGKIEQMVERGTFLSNIKMPTLSEVGAKWLEYKKPNVRASTFEQYEGHVSNHLKPYFGMTQINKVNFDAIERYIAYANQNGIRKPTLRKILITLGAILSYAVKKRYIDFNPMRDVEKPKGITRAGKEMEFLKPEEIRAFLKNIGDQKYKTLFTLAVMSGMRQGEILGLKWADIDWFNNQVLVNRTFNHGKFYEPKSNTSRRSIDIGSTVMAEIRKWRLACPPNELGLVFPNENGKPIDCNNMIKYQFQPALRRAGLRKIRFHDLRHTYATLFINQGEHPKYIQTQMGHSSIKVTMDTYGHLMESVNSEAAKRLEMTVFGQNGDILETKTTQGLSQIS